MIFSPLPRTNNSKVVLAKLLTALRVPGIYDLFFVPEEPNQFYMGDGLNVGKDLLPYQTAVKNHRPVAVNATATLTAAQVKLGVVTSTSAAAVTLTTPTAALLVAALKARPASWFDFVIDNSAGANPITLVGGTGVTAATAVITGGATLTVANGAAGLFRLYFVSATVVKIYRIG